MYRWRHHSRALLIARRLSGGFPEEGGAGQKDGIYVQRAALEGLLFVGHVSIRGMGHVRRFFILSSSFFIKKGIQVTMARRFHLFPFRTEKLSFVTPMVLRKWESR